MLSHIVVTLMLAGICEAVGLAKNPDPLDIVRSRGFIPEHHELVSHGYRLFLTRIINPLADRATLNKYPVIYGHGILLDSSSMIMVSEHSRPRKPVIGQPNILYERTPDGVDDNNFPFMLSNNNFDVWLFEERGVNERVRNFSDLDLAEVNKFWDFSLDEEALEDVPAIIDYVLAKTCSQKLVYVGYSESTFFLLALMSSYPQYQDKIGAAVLMAPVAYVGHLMGLTVPSMIGPVAALPDSINYSLLPRPIMDAIDLFLENMCSSKSISKTICNGVFTSIAGKGTSANHPVFFKNFFKHTSTKAMKHFLQLYVSKRFGRFDYGPIKNLNKYGVPLPPSYDLGMIRSDRLILARGQGDFLSTPPDQTRLVKELGAKPYLDLILPGYNHFDFIDGQNMTNVLNAPALIAVYELLHKDGPNILKTSQQLACEFGASGTGTGAIAAANVQQGPVPQILSQNVANNAGPGQNFFFPQNQTFAGLNSPVALGSTFGLNQNPLSIQGLLPPMLPFLPLV